MATRQQVVDEARTWMGTRWIHQGRLKGVGVDCINLVVGTALNLGLITQEQLDNFHNPEYANYGRSPNGVLLLEGCNYFLDPIPFSQVRKGDILIFKFVEEPQHFGIVTESNPIYIIHAFAHARKVVEHRLDDVWKNRIVACFRFKTIED
jgi:NlpC/P60 family putative phage cell wall peptidase